MIERPRDLGWLPTIEPNFHTQDFVETPSLSSGFTEATAAGAAAFGTASVLRPKGCEQFGFQENVGCLWGAYLFFLPKIIVEI